MVIFDSEYDNFFFLKFESKFGYFYEDERFVRLEDIKVVDFKGFFIVWGR